MENWTTTRPSVPTSAQTTQVVPAVAHACVVGSSAVQTAANWALAPVAAAATLPVAAVSGYEVRLVPTSAQQQGTTVEISTISFDEQSRTTSTISNKVKTDAKGAGMATSLRHSGGVPPRGRPV
ncbi:hypothetical protein GCM10009681_52040 [Luedemannella helvata]|uniref:Uncharacterized protein n=1 Tax=Luedemannella helvata TaxID=349315 RepID=A0ABN2L3S9_9ACTN